MRWPRVLVVVLAATSCVGTTEERVAPARPARVYRAPAPRPRGEGTMRVPPRPGAYDLGQLPVLTKVLFYVRESYFDKRRLSYREMAMGALEFVQRDVPEVIVEGHPEHGELIVGVAGARRTFSFQRGDQPWNLRSKLQEIFRFIQANLPPLPPDAEGRRLLDMEIAAVNGMLYTLDPHSVLLDEATYEQMRTRPADVLPASIGLTVRLDSAGRVVVVGAQSRSPAESAGVAAGDRIVRIEDDPAQNMSLDEVIARLHGAEGSKVELTLERPGHRGFQRKTIVRAMICFQSISPAPRLLSDKIGYFRLRHLGANASLDVHEALRSFINDGADGLIMDLRGNGGGLYDQAHKVADEFVDQGTIVSMVGPDGSRRKDSTATATALTPQLPLVVLVDHDTASGAEIIAAAMKNLDRGVVIGQLTFGEGSVQVLYDIPSPLAKGPDDEGKLGLKLTTAQILAAGGTAIQDWGVRPDISMEPMSVPATDLSSPVHLQASRSPRSEHGYEKSLPPLTRPPREAPAESVRYLRPEGEGDVPPDPDTDPVVALARELLRQNNGFERHQVLASSAEGLARWRDEQDRRLVAALGHRGIDWSNGPADAPPPLQLTLARVEAKSGRPTSIRGTVKNLGSAPAFRVRAVVASDDPNFDEAELVFGRIAPGQSKSYDLSIARRPTERTRTAVLKATLLAQDHPLAGQTELRVDVEGAPPPALAFRYEVPGNSERGRPIEIPVTVTNRGPGDIAHLRATLVPDLPGQRVRIPKGRFELTSLAAGASQTVTFAVVVDAASAADHCQLKLALDPDSGESLARAVRIQLGAAAAVVEVEPPRLALQGPTSVAGATVHIAGTVTSDRGVRDVYVRVWNRNLKMPVRKVFYQLNQPANGPQLSLAADIPVTPGMNLIQVFARDAADVQSQQSLIVLRER